MKSLQEFVVNNEVFVVAHRGSSGTAPENTIAAFREAIDAGAMMLETDVQFTNDGHIVVLHDLSVIAPANNISEEIDFTLKNLKSLDAGAWFHPKFKGERIPELRELLDLIKGKVYLNLEIKSQQTAGYEDKLRQLITEITDAGVIEQVVFASFSYRILALIKTINPGMHTAAIKRPDVQTLPSKICSEIGAEAFVCSIEELNDEIAEDVKKNKLFFGIYSVDNREQLEYALKFGVNALGTNYPAIISKELAEIQGR
ncbi:MAG: glycerophosphodiester phosphodiesterase family protein [Bacteroidota bacterium]